MPNVNGSTYGLTVLSPVKIEELAVPSPEQRLRTYLNGLPDGTASPFAKVHATHLARFAIINDTFFEGFPSAKDHLKSRYLMFSSNFDGDLDPYLDQMFDAVPDVIDGIWGHCVGFPGTDAGKDAWRRYLKACQIETTFFFAAVNDMSVEEMLQALMLQQGFARFVIANQGNGPDVVQQNFAAFMDAYRAAATPARGSVEYAFPEGGTL